MTDPTHTTVAQQRAAYDALGLDPNLFEMTESILIRSDAVTVTRFRTDPETGQVILGAIATRVAVLPLATSPDEAP
jgi:hypothetical protein